MGAAEPQAVLQPLNVTVTLDDAKQQHLAAAGAIVAEAKDLVIDSPPMAQFANTFLRDIKTKKTRIQAMHDDIVGPLKLALANAKGWFTPSLDAHDEAEGIVKEKLADFSKREQERAAAEERARRDAERRAREEAEQLAAAARARAEEAARKARQEAAAAEEARRKAEEEARVAREAGNKKAAAEAERRAQAAAAESAKKEEEERQRREGAEREVARIQMESAVKAQASAPVVTAPTTIKGFGMRKNWVAELADDVDEDRAKALIVQAISEGRRDLLGLLSLNLPAANKLAKAQEKNFNVPGLKARNDEIATSRKG